MAKNRKQRGIYWDFGWKLVEGCTKCSPGCQNCWSLEMENRFRKENGVKFMADRLGRPVKRRKPATYAIWNDLFHKNIDFKYIEMTWNNMILCPQHTFFVLTKRPKRMLDFVIKHSFVNYVASNIWLGVTAENQEQADKRIPILLQIPAKVRFVSCEPLLSEINFRWTNYHYLATKETYREYLERNGSINEYESLNQIDWIIAGPETGPKKRECKKEWIESLYNQCKEADIPFFDKKNILGKNIQEYPEL